MTVNKDKWVVEVFETPTSIHSTWEVFEDYDEAVKEHHKQVDLGYVVYLLTTFSRCCDGCGAEIDIDNEKWVEYHHLQDGVFDLCWECYGNQLEEWNIS